MPTHRLLAPSRRALVSPKRERLFKPLSHDAWIYKQVEAPSAPLPPGEGGRRPGEGRDLRPMRAFDLLPPLLPFYPTV